MRVPVFQLACPITLPKMKPDSLNYEISNSAPTIVVSAFPSEKRKFSNYEGDISDIRELRHVNQHPDSWRVWQPFIAQWKSRHLIVAFGAMTNGKKDMGDIFAMVSRNDGDTWEEPVAIFDHNIKQGDLQFAYANPVLFKPTDQNVVWCFAMRCSIKQENSEESHLVAAFSADGDWS